MLASVLAALWIDIDILLQEYERHLGLSPIGRRSGFVNLLRILVQKILCSFTKNNILYIWTATKKILHMELRSTTLQLQKKKKGKSII